MYTYTHGSFLIRRQHGHPGVCLPLVIYNSANYQEGMQFELSPIRHEPDYNLAQVEMSHGYIHRYIMLYPH